MSADPAVRKATYAALEAVPPHLVAEIIDGVLETRPRPTPRHGASALGLGYELSGLFQRGRGGPGGWMFIAEPELHLGSDVVVPDLAGWRRERLPTEPASAFIETPPDWVCETLSPSTERLDRGPKRRIDARVDVSHLWLLATIEPGEEVRVAPFDAIGFPLEAPPFPFDTPAPDTKPFEEA